MLVDLELISDDAKVWIYPSSRKFYPTELETLTETLTTFVNDWHKDAAGFKVAVTLKYDRFIVFFTESEQPLQNAQIDQLVSFILSLEAHYQVALLDKMNVCFKQGEFVQYKDLKVFQQLIKQKAVSKKTIVFDNLIQTKEEFDHYWEVPITESWYNRFLK